jgi:hypothetical protein
MGRRQNDFYHIEKHRFRDAKIHAGILDDGDHAAAQKVSDQVARDIGLTKEEIAVLKEGKANETPTA